MMHLTSLLKRKKLQIAPYNRSFESKTLWQRFLTIFAGPMMNFILAFFLFIIVALATGKPVTTPVINEVIGNNPASISGILPGDKIISIGTVQVDSWSKIGDALDQYAGSYDVSIVILRNGVEQTFTITPRVDINSMGFIEL